MSHSEAEAAMTAAMDGARRRQDYYQAGPGIPAGTAGADPQPLALPADPQVTGVSDHPLLAGGE